MPDDLILVYFLADQAAGYEFARTRNDWPMHITLVPWFGGADTDELSRGLKEIAHGTQPFGITLGEVQKFNPETTISLLTDQTNFRALHDRALEVVASSGGTLRTDRWVSNRLKAHVTHHDSQPKPLEGDVHHIAAFWAVSLLPGSRCKVMQKFELGSEA